MTVDRRTLLALGLAAPFAMAARAPAIDESAARAEFGKILTMFNTGDVAGFLAYGPPRLVVEKKLLTRDTLPAFFESCRANEGNPDEKPGWIDGTLVRRERPSGAIVFGATTKRSVWNPAWCDQASAISQAQDTCYTAGYQPRFEHWELFFESGRIAELNQWLAMQ
jgi:hypothetical protein